MGQAITKLANEVVRFVQQDAGPVGFVVEPRDPNLKDTEAATLKFAHGMIEVDLLTCQGRNYAHVTSHRGGYKIEGPVYTANATAHAAGDVVRELELR